MKLEIAYISEKGLREKNEDSYLVKEFKDLGIYLLAVADGLGGHDAGEIASKLALVEIEETFKKNISQNLKPKEILSLCIEKAGKELYDLSKYELKYVGLGTTLVLALISNGEAVIANIGDSRAYKIREDGIKRITKDHSLVRELVEKGVITEGEARGHPQLSVVTKSLGVKENVEADYYEIELDQDYLLLCTDGLHDVLSDEEIEKIVVGASSLQEACKALVNKAIEQGSSDNITVVIARRNEEEIMLE